MLKALIARYHQKHRTAAYPQVAPTLPDRFRGAPVLDETKCADGCRACADACPTDAIQTGSQGHTFSLDLGRCLFCTDCTDACPSGAVTFSRDWRLAASSRDELRVGGRETYRAKARALDEKLRKLYGRSLKLRVVSAAGCNACEADVNVLSTVVFDLGRFGIQVVASPRHADGLLVTGCVSDHMKDALLKTWDAIPGPKIAIAVGACAISGGPYSGHPEIHDGATDLLPIDLYIPGCPPHPYTILDGLLRLLGRLDEKMAGGSLRGNDVGHRG